MKIFVYILAFILGIYIHRLLKLNYNIFEKEFKMKPFLIDLFSLLIIFFILNLGLRYLYNLIF